MEDLIKGGIIYMSTGSGGIVGAFNAIGASGGVSSVSIDATNNSIKLQRGEGRSGIKSIIIISTTRVVSVSGSDS